MPDLKKLNLYVPALRFHEIMLITMKITRHLFISYFSYQFFKNIHLRLKAIEILEEWDFRFHLLFFKSRNFEQRASVIHILCFNQRFMSFSQISSCRSKASYIALKRNNHCTVVDVDVVRKFLPRTSWGKSRSSLVGREEKWYDCRKTSKY